MEYEKMYFNIYKFPDKFVFVHFKSTSLWNWYLSYSSVAHFLDLVTCFVAPVIPMPCCCMPVFGTEQFGGILPYSIFTSIPWLSVGPSSYETSHQSPFLDSTVEQPYSMLSPLQSFNVHVHYQVSVFIESVLTHICTILHCTIFPDAINLQCSKYFPKHFSFTATQSFVWHSGKASMFHSHTEKLGG